MARRPSSGTAEAKVAQAWREIAMTPQGKVALAELFASLNVYSEVHASDPITAGIAIGERNVAARIARWIGRKPGEYVETAREDMTVLEHLMNDGGFY